MDEPADATQTLIEQAAGGDRAAADRLFARYAPALHRWAHGRLPRWARDIADTTDVVQDALLQTFKNLKGFEYRGEGALQAYLRAAVMNRIREELRRRDRGPERTELQSSMPGDDTSPLEAAMSQQMRDKYERALLRVTDEEREAIIARVELGLSHAEIAEALDKPSPDAARMFVARALVKLAKEMDEIR